MEMKLENQSGVSMMEVLVIMFVFSIISLAVANSAMVGFRTYHFVRLKAAADALAMSKMEQWAALNPDDYDASNSASETGLSSVSVNNISFTRTTTIVVNADESRTVTVAVTSEDGAAPSRINSSFTSTYSLWSYGG